MPHILEWPFPVNTIILFGVLVNVFILIGIFRECEYKSTSYFLLKFTLHVLAACVIVDGLIYGAFLLNPIFSLVVTILVLLGICIATFPKLEEFIIALQNIKITVVRGRYESPSGRFFLTLPQGWSRSTSIHPQFKELQGVAFVDRSGASVNISFGPLELNQSIDPIQRERQMIEFLWKGRTGAENHMIVPGGFRPARCDMNIAAAALVAEHERVDGRYPS